MKYLKVKKTNKELIEAIDSMTDTDDEYSEDFGKLDLIEPEIYDFLRKHNIDSGENKVDKTTLYGLYNHSTIKPYGSRSFHTYAKRYLEFNDKFYLINKTLDNLLDIISIEVKQTNKKKDVLNKQKINAFKLFLDKHNIKKGKGIYVASKVLYYFYDIWTYKKKKQRVSLRQFNKLLKLFFNEHKNLSQQDKYYEVDPQIYEKITEENFEKASSWAKKFKS